MEQFSSKLKPPKCGKPDNDQQKQRFLHLPQEPNESYKCQKREEKPLKIYRGLE